MCARILIALAAAALPALGQQPSSATLTLQADKPGPQISRNIYGQFAEHLGPASTKASGSAKTPRFRTRADPQRCRGGAERAEGAGAALARRLFRRRVPLEGRHRPARKRPVSDQLRIGAAWWRTTTSARTSSWTSASMLGADPYICGNVGSGRFRRLMEWVEYMTSAEPIRRWPTCAQNGRDRAVEGEVSRASATKAGAAAAT